MPRWRNPPLPENIDKKYCALNSIIYDYFVLSMVSLQAKFFIPNIQFRFILKSDHLFYISSLFGQIPFNKANRFFSSCLLEFQNRNFHC